MAEILSPAQLKRLTEHRYVAEGASICEPVMQKFWRWLVEQLPLWCAPNALTLAGLLMNVGTTFILMFYSPDARQEPPCMAYLLAAVGLMVYQCLDAVDGKQARRTNSATPLGELFDHGCDSLSTVFVILGMAIALQLGYSPEWLFILCFSATFMFYAAHWQTYCSGILRFGFIDVTEAQFAVTSIYVLSAIFGAGIWSYRLPVVGFELKLIPVFISLSGCLNAAVLYFRIILVQGGVGKSGSTVAGTSVLSPMLPIGAVVLLAVMIWQKSSSGVFENHPVLYTVSFGMVSAKITNKLVIAHMTKSEMDFFDTSMIGPGMLFLNQYFNTPINEYFVLWVCFFYCTADLLRYSRLVCVQICNYLDIYCFKITPPTKSKSTEKTRPPTYGPLRAFSSNLNGNSEYSRPVTRQQSSKSSMSGN